MKAVEAISEILKREGVEVIIGYPVNHILEYAARADIREELDRLCSAFVAKGVRNGTPSHAAGAVPRDSTSP